MPKLTDIPHNEDYNELQFLRATLLCESVILEIRSIRSEIHNNISDGWASINDSLRRRLFTLRNRRITLLALRSHYRVSPEFIREYALNAIVLDDNV
jgi:hypothetical protein